MNYKIISCANCKLLFYRSNRQINENKKIGYNNYCSKRCIALSKNRQVNTVCANLLCKKSFTKRKSQISDHNYCSRSCSAIINNIKFPKLHALSKSCANCTKKFKSNSKYCSILCKVQHQSIPANELVKQIQKFYKINSRIPFKIEFKSYRAAQKRFGSWNKAIKAAGYLPNPVRFSHKYIANDGHKCDSLAERIIDDWLTANKINHERSVPYGENNMTADFRIKNIFIEFIGLKGQFKKYDETLAKKMNMWKTHKFKVITIYPHDLFPILKLKNILKELI